MLSLHGNRNPRFGGVFLSAHTYPKKPHEQNRLNTMLRSLLVQMVHGSIQSNMGRPS